MHHVWRVFRLGVRFADQVGADREVVGAAALTHDVHRVIGDGTGVDPGETLDEIRAILDRADFPVEKRDAVCPASRSTTATSSAGTLPTPKRFRRRSSGTRTTSTRWGRSGSVGCSPSAGSTGRPCETRRAGGYSQLYHFEDKLLRLTDELHTEPARELAAERHDFLVEFHERFRREWNGDS